MGCDIHTYREKLVNGQWVNDSPMAEDEVWDRSVQEEVLQVIPQRVYNGRDYGLFGLLNKGVRYEHDLSFPYSETPPDNLSPEVQERVDYWEGDGHSFGSLTLAQIKVKQAELLLDTSTDGQYLAGALAGFRSQAFNENDDPEGTRVVFFFDN